VQKFGSRAGHHANYLRAAQAYILISMPTGTSTIFGAFQAIDVLQCYGANANSRIAGPASHSQASLP